MPILMDPSARFGTTLGMQYAASEDSDDDNNYSFSLSDLPEEEDNVADPALLSRAFEDSISFSFSTENPSETECFSASLPLLNYAHAGAFESSTAGNSIVRLHVEDEENASLVPFKISGSWRAESSLRHSARHAESRRSFSFLTDKEHETEHSKELLMQLKGSTMVRDSGLCNDGEDAATHAGGKHEGGDDDNARLYSGNNEEGDDDGAAFSKHAHDNDDDDDIHIGSVNDSGNDDRDMFGKHAHHDDNKHADYEHVKLFKRAFSDHSKEASALRFAGEGLLQPWSSSKLSKSCGHQMNAGMRKSQVKLHSSNGSPKNMNHLHPLPSSPPINNLDEKATGTRPASRMQSSESEPFSPRRHTSFMKGVFSPSHAPLYMPKTTRTTSSLFARRLPNADETLSLLVNAQRPITSFLEAAPSPLSNGSAYSSSYRTSSNGSTQSSGYSSSPGKSSTPNSRNSSRNASLADARCSLRQRMDAEALKSHRQADPSAQLHRKGDPNAQLHRKGDPSGHMCEKVDLCIQGQSKVKTESKAAGHERMSPLISPSPRSPLSWRSVLSLQPLNPSHVPLDEWELLGKPSSRSHSQRSRASCKGSRGNSVMMAGNRNEALGQPNCKQASTVREGMKKASNQKMVKNRRGYWALNPMQWFRHCKNDQQVVEYTSSLDSRHAVYQACK